MLDCEIIIHLGAHKTATTAIQRGLLGAEEGEYYSLPDAVYVDLRSLDELCMKVRGLWGRGHQSVEGRAVLSSAFRELILSERAKNPNKRLVFSYENLCGNYNLASTKLLYPKLGLRMQVLEVATRDFDTNYVLGIRDFGRFIESTHAQLIKARTETRPFAEYYGLIDVDAVSWENCFRRIGKVVGEENLLVYRFEDYVMHPNAYLESIFGLVAETPFSELPIANPSLTGKALEIVRQLNPLLTRMEKNKLRRFVSRHFAETDGYDEYRPLCDTERERLARKYQVECERLPLFTCS